MVALTETWFCPTESASQTLCTSAGYKLLHHPRTSQSGGGTGVLFRDNLTVKKGVAAELRSFEFSESEIKAETGRIHLIIIYRTPYSEAHPVTTSVFLEEFSTFLESAVFCTNHLLITGDFNIHMDVADDPDAIRMRGLLESTGLKQHVNIPTHISGHILDLLSQGFPTIWVSLRHGPTIYSPIACLSTANCKYLSQLSKDRRYILGKPSPSTEVH